MSTHSDSAMRAETEDWMKSRAQLENAWLRERQWCVCRKPVEGPQYLRHKSCKLCGRLLKRGRT